VIPLLSTPALVVDLDVFDANVGAMAELLRGTG
jgi:D-serine deaminase-like pyridoxal phosphate-dependent protein